MPEDLPEWIKKLIEIAKEKGHITFEDINTSLPSDPFTSAQIEDGMSMLAALEYRLSTKRQTMDGLATKRCALVGFGAWKWR
jgi:RNA polymerase primary sigma factor